MTSETLYRLQDYKEVLRIKVDENKEIRAYQTEMARSAGCHKSFLSQVLNSHIHLTPDHAAGITRFWKLNEVDANYFIDLVLLARAGSPVLRQIISQRLQGRQKKMKQVASRFDASKKLPTDELARYYSTWYYPAVHMLLSVPGYQSSDRLSERLKLPIGLVTNTLEHLERMRLIEKKAAGWKIKEQDLFLPNGSPIAEAHHAVWRQKASLQMQERDTDSIHFTYLYAMSTKEIRKMREQLLTFISEARKAVLESPEEDLLCFACDFFLVK